MKNSDLPLASINFDSHSVSHIRVSIARQRLVLSGDGIQHTFSIATARNGSGQEYGSECTPLGYHRIRAKIGKDAPVGTVFVARRPTGEVYSENLGREYPHRDWILSRILWLCGNEPGINRLGNVDTMRRYIYIHGAPDSHPMGVPSSHGCIKMRNADVIQLFDLVEVGTPVIITAD